MPFHNPIPVPPTPPSSTQTLHTLTILLLLLLHLHPYGRPLKFKPLNLHSICREWGAFNVVNHGVSADLLNKMQSAGLQFFAESPLEEKMMYASDPSSVALEGYGSRMLVAKEDGVLDWRDYFDPHTLPESQRNISRWPDFPINYGSVEN